MANDINSIYLIGRLTRDPEYKIINQSSVVNFSIANNRVYVSNGVKKEDTNFFDCVAWGKLAEIIKQYATKGKQVMIQGRLQQQTWDAPDGKKMSKIRIFTENLQFLGSKNDKGTGGDKNYESYSPPSDFAPATSPVNFSKSDESKMDEIDPEDIF
ncbi:MAG: single-stranded DNA-binding protein [Leptospiraceae bacterium]|nr:single-stranded DNA-binding protein [Leptospiraceae bacterium]MCP5495625.1 single-stranded DNA-binding protein [Leptospiraceae bacterium]